MKLKINNKGYVALVTVLIVSAVGLAIATTLLLYAIGVSKSSITYDSSDQARAYADSCAEEAIVRLKRDISYTGNETLTFDYGSCEIRPVLGSGNTDRTVQTIGNVGNTYRKVEVQISVVNPQTQINIWEEVSDF
jgi:hypothetical protein